MNQDLPDDYSPYPKSRIGRLISSFFNLTEHFTGTGDWKVRPIQRQLLDAYLSALEPGIRVLLEQQLAQPFFMQFWHKGRISPFFFKNFRLPKEIRLPIEEFAERLDKIEMYVDGRKQNAHIVFVSGRIHRIEFKKPFKFYEGKAIRFGKITVGNSKDSVAVVIDRQEHGKNGRMATGDEELNLPHRT